MFVLHSNLRPQGPSMDFVWVHVRCSDTTRWAHRGWPYWFSLHYCLSCTVRPISLSVCATIIPNISTISLSLPFSLPLSYRLFSLSLYFYFLLLFRLSPACKLNNASLLHPGNKPGSPFFLHIHFPWWEQKPIKVWLNYSCWLSATHRYNTMCLRMGQAWAKCDSQGKQNNNFFLKIHWKCLFDFLHPQDATSWL